MRQVPGAPISSSQWAPIRQAVPEDIIACKRIADQNREAFGFLPRPVFVEAVERRRLLVAASSTGVVIGFVRFNHRMRGTETALYDICVDNSLRRQGVGRALVAALVDECRRANRETVVLKCPEGLPANDFYDRLGFERQGMVQGRRRNLIIWCLSTGNDLCSS
jgi:ribosomal protein S18 acetylase RimI-like enzyme